jgi:hypothetical protein
MERNAGCSVPVAVFAIAVDEEMRGGRKKRWELSYTSDPELGSTVCADWFV